MNAPAGSRRVRAHGEAVDVLLVCSSGGHLLELLALREAWEPFSHAWVTDDTTDARSLLEREDVYYAWGPTDRSLKNLFRNALVAWRVMRARRPRVILTTGAGIAVPLCWVGRLLGARIVFVESLTRIEDASLSCRLIRPVADRIYVQWPQLAPRIPGAVYAGNVFSQR